MLLIKFLLEFGSVSKKKLGRARRSGALHGFFFVKIHSFLLRNEIVALLQRC
jgi:hypothetical protein